jgi:LssY C-terminus
LEAFIRLVQWKPVDLAALREKLAQLRCCTTNKAGNTNGDPLNIVVVGRGIDALFAFIERGWRFDEPFDLHSTYRTIRAFLFGSEYFNAPVSPLYVFGREQDVALQKARDTVSQRNHLRLWLAPFTIDGLQVWVGQISRDIGIKLTTQSWYLTTHVISPDVDQDRFYLMQDLILSGAVSRFGLNTRPFHRPPKALGDLERCYSDSGPPATLVTGTVELAVMFSAERHGEFIARLAAERPWLGKSQVMGIARHALTDQARLRGNQGKVSLVAAARCL